MTVSVVNYDNSGDCYEYKIITIIIITGTDRSRRRRHCGWSFCLLAGSQGRSFDDSD